MPVEIDIENSKDLKATVMDILNSTFIRLTGKGPIIDINAFLSTHTVAEALENINKIREILSSKLPGGEKNIKSIYLKSTNAPAVPIYVNETTDPNEIKLTNNLTPEKIKQNKKFKLKRLKRMKMLKEKSSAAEKASEKKPSAAPKKLLKAKKITKK